MVEGIGIYGCKQHPGNQFNYLSKPFKISLVLLYLAHPGISFYLLVPTLNLHVQFFTLMKQFKCCFFVEKVMI